MGRQQISKPIVSIIVPVFNEEKVIAGCIKSLVAQSYSPLEIIIVDDGSTDNTKSKVKDQKSKLQFKNLKILDQNHQGPGPARNLGAKHARGEIFVFVDADMTFDRDFVDKLTLPIRQGKTIGTFSKEEYLANKNNIWAICWNINKGLPVNKMHPDDYPNTQSVFRAILKNEFDKVGGFDPIGYTDDWSLSRKLKKQATTAPGAIFYHKNPDNLNEIWQQARWIGKNEFITGSLIRKLWSFWVYALPNSVRKAIYLSIINRLPQFFVFKLWYDLAVFTSVVVSFFGEDKAK